MFNNKTRVFLLFTLILIAIIGISAATAADIDSNATDAPVIADTPAQESAGSVQINDLSSKNMQIEKNTIENVKGGEEATDEDFALDGDEGDSGSGGASAAETESPEEESNNPSVFTINNNNWTSYFNNDGTTKEFIVSGSELRFYGEFSDRDMLITIPLNLTTADTQAVFKDCTFLITADDVNVTKLQMTSMNAEDALITTEDASNIYIADNTLVMTNNEDLETRSIIIDGGSDVTIFNNTITTVGPEKDIVYGADSSINELDLTSIEATADRLILNKNTITTKKNDKESEELGTIFGVYVHGTSDNYLDSVQIINNEVITEGKVYDYGIKPHFVTKAIIENNTVTGTSDKYISGIHAFVANDSFINKNNVNGQATEMCYGIVLEGAMDTTSQKVISSKNVVVSNNNVEAKAKYVWAVEAYAGDNNDISYNNITVTADNGIAIGLADQNSLASHNNIEVNNKMTSDITGSFDYIDPYTAGIKVSLNGLQDANKNSVKYNNITVIAPGDVYAVNVTTNDNSITDNYLVSPCGDGDNAVLDKGSSNTIENNIPNISVFTLNDGNWTEYFNDDGTTKEFVETGSVLRFEGEFSNRDMLITKALNLTTADTQAVFKDCTFLITADDVNITKLQMTSMNTEDALITTEDASDIYIADNTLVMTNNENLETRSIIIDGGSDVTILNNTITTVGPENRVTYGGDSSIQKLYLTSIEATADSLTLDKNKITTKPNSNEPEAYGTIFGVYIHGTDADNYVENTYIINNEFITEGKVYDYGIRVNFATAAIIYNNTVTTTSEYYASGIHVFAIDYSIIDHNTVKCKANNMTYGIVLEGAMSLDEETYGEILSTENTYVSNNIVNAESLFAWAVETFAGIENGILNNTITVDADQGIGIGLTDQDSTSAYNNITVNSKLSGASQDSYDYIDPYTTGVKITDNGLQQVSGNTVKFNNIIVNAPKSDISGVNLTIGRDTENSITDNYIIAPMGYGDGAVITTGTKVTVKDNLPKSATLTLDEITDAKYNGNVTISGTLINDDSIGLNNQTITLTIGDKEVNVTTKGGIFEYTSVFKEVGEKTVTATYAGTEEYGPSEANTTFTIGKQDIVITYDSIADVAYGDNVTITGKFTQANGKAISNSNVNVYINGKQYKARTDKTGAFTLTAPVKAIGTNNVTLSYGGNTYYNSYETKTTFNAGKQDILITYDSIADIAYGDNVTITGKFTQANGKAISNSNVNVYINGKQYKARTDKTGAFTLSVRVKAIGTSNVTLSYGGNAYYNSYETSTTFNADKQDILITYDSIQDTRCGDNVTITGKFAESNGNAISNSNVNVYINGKQYKARTDKTGAFKLSAETKVVGINNVTFSYGGNACYNSYETSTTFNVIAKNE
jgi:translation elongation factor P/translation initiation factor 5A